jgi:hypothetical protein
MERAVRIIEAQELEEAVNKGGRPTVFKPEFIEQANKLAASGLTDFEIAKFFDISDRTLYRWLHDHPKFCQALKIGKEALDDRVERSLFHRAIGYTHNAVKIMTLTDRDGESSSQEIVKVPYEEHIPPDTAAAIFWLRNRRRTKWKNSDGEVGQITNLSFTLNIGAASERIEENMKTIDGKASRKKEEASS